MNFHGLSFDSINPFFTRSSFFLFYLPRTSTRRPINEQKKSYKIKIIDYTTKCRKKGKKLWKFFARFFKNKNFIAAFPPVEGITKSAAELRHFSWGWMGVNDIYVNVISYTKTWKLARKKMNLKPSDTKRKNFKNLTSLLKLFKPHGKKLACEISRWCHNLPNFSPRNSFNRSKVAKRCDVSINTGKQFSKFISLKNIIEKLLKSSRSNYC